MAESKAREWPLIVFTVGLQLAAGIQLSTALALWLDPGNATPLTVLAISVFPISAVAVAISFFHLGRPLAGWRSFANISQSKLSREIVVCSLFCVGAFAQCIEYMFPVARTPGLTPVTAVVGIAAVVASARIYALPGQPLWNSGWVTSSFIGSMLLLGGVVAKIADDSYRPGTAIMIGAVVLLSSSAVMVMHILRISRSRYAPPEAVSVMQMKHWLSFLGSIAGTVMPILGGMVTDNSGRLSVASVIMAVAGVVLGRALMYSRGIALSRF
ncbi:MAG TPA: DmsC/YnfH family molybdoenzyme membrane anchor subunit [Terriglobales bacterium]